VAARGLVVGGGAYAVHAHVGVPGVGPSPRLPVQQT